MSVAILLLGLSVLHAHMEIQQMRDFGGLLGCPPEIRIVTP
jgi:hypothetical protein